MYKKSFFPIMALFFFAGCASNQVNNQNDVVTIETQSGLDLEDRNVQLRLTKKFQTLNEYIRFGFASAELSPTNKLVLEEIAHEMKKSAGSFKKVRIIGFTDPTGHSNRNKRLSLARADKVKQYLISRGVPAEKIEAIGKGPWESLAKRSKSSEIHLAKARRVDFEIID